MDVYREADYWHNNTNQFTFFTVTVVNTNNFNVIKADGIDKHNELLFTESKLNDSSSPSTCSKPTVLQQSVLHT